MSRNNSASIIAAESVLPTNEYDTKQNVDAERVCVYMYAFIHAGMYVEFKISTVKLFNKLCCSNILGARKPSRYYRLPTMTLQDIAMNAIFDNYGCGYEMLPPPLNRLYYEHIHCIPK